ncbi:sucrose-6-phosphate hydrolase [Ammoniphilus sp. YIM 78166]|uniref:glycoside hydrolase family 32 protein n=1 Tax=Ammoniphilus sp. YIM 78166 TaxID=1644106 RepID=UPI00106FAE52|nr:sucrose-6-phosphate hydrolase [Ammoniphilus sp. YIM 78166]
MNVKDQELREQATLEIQKHKLQVESDPYRLTYHLMPPVGLLNDPNGFIHWKGTYHLFYQWMPFKTGHGAKFWGHYSSPDLVHWTHEGIALTPSDWFDKNGCYSGSAVDDNGTLTVFYTGNVKDEKNNRETYQCLAVSEDGLEFEKQGVVATLPKGYTAHFRDPKVWKKGEHWYMVVGAQSLQLDGKAVLFRSSNLKEWEHLGAIAGGNTDRLGYFGYMWECPDLFELNGKDVLVVCPQGIEPEGMLYQNVYQAGYFVGQLDYEKARYTHGQFTELDRGFEFYAPQTTLDAKGRRLLVAWMGVPDQQEDQQPTISHKWVHTMTIPRELTLIDGKLYQQPIKELEQLRQNQVSYEQVSINNGVLELDQVRGKSIELGIQDLSYGDRSIEISLRGEIRFIYDPQEKQATLERKSYVNGLTEARHCRLERLTSLQIFLDTSSLEIFVNGGEEVFTSRIFPYPDNELITFASKGSFNFHVNKWDLKYD